MFKNHLLITIRNMMKNKMYLFINIFGLGIAIACCIVGYFNYDFNDSFDEHHQQAETVYRINSIREFQGNTTEFGVVPIGLGNVARQSIKDIDHAVRYNFSGVNFKVEDDLFPGGMAYVDPEFFNLFTFEFIAGSPDALKDKSKVVLSEELAMKLFNSTDVAGRMLTQVFGENKTKEVEVGAVFKKQPTNSSFSEQAYSHYDNYFEEVSDLTEDNWFYRSTLFVQIKNPERLTAIGKQLNAFTTNNNTVREDFIIKDFKLDPFVGMAVRDSYNDIPGTWTRSGSPIAAVMGVGLMGTLLLLIACFNLTNTAIAISSRRLKEIGIRKVMGSMRVQLIFQFIGETLFICFIALLVGMLLAEFLLIPAFNALWPAMKLSTDYAGKPDFMIFMVGVLLFTGLLAGSYPAFYVSRFEPTTILKGKLKFGGTNIFTRVLLTLQFAISLIAVVCGFAFTDNAKYQREFDLGFNKNGVVYTYVNSRSEYEALRNLLIQNPDIISIAGSENHIYSNYNNDPIKHEGAEIEVDILNVGDDYLKTVGFELIEGRDFAKDSETDRKESVIVTESVARKFGWDKPIGKEITWMDTTRLYVVGVVRDVYNRGLWDEMEPMILRYGDKEKVNHVIVSAPVDKLKAVHEFMGEKFNEVFPNRLYNGRYQDDSMAEANYVNNNIVKMFLFLGIVAVLLSATGLFTLVSLNIIKRMKEIGVRKVLGASMANISKVINKEFVIILLVASVIGGYLGSWLCVMMMDSIWDYYQNPTAITLIISAAVLFIVSILSIGYKIYNTVRLNPANVLRDE